MIARDPDDAGLYTVVSYTSTTFEVCNLAVIQLCTPKSLILARTVPDMRRLYRFFPRAERDDAFWFERIGRVIDGFQDAMMEHPGDPEALRQWGYAHNGVIQIRRLYPTLLAGTTEGLNKTYEHFVREGDD